MKHKKSFLNFGFLAAVCMYFAVPADATLIISVEPVTAAPGTTGGTFDVLLTDSGSAGVSVAGFSFEIQSSNPAITFTGAFTSTATATYIFNGNSLFGPEIDTQTTPSLIAQDLAASGSTILNSGDVVGLGQVFFNVSPTATPGPVTVSFTGGLAGNDLSDPAGANIPINTFTSGTINITSTPEPSSLLMLLAGTAALAAWNRWRRA
jgi:PEP-CTERM motif